MIVKMDDKAYGYLKNKSQEVTLELVTRGGCCVGVGIPNLVFRKPQNPHFFTKLTFKDLSVFVSKGIDFRDDVVEIVLTKRLFLNDFEFPTLKLI